jgi:hypothetical protein
MVEHVEGLYGRASRIWVMDRGMAGEDKVEFLREGGRRYINRGCATIDRRDAQTTGR